MENGEWRMENERWSEALSWCGVLWLFVAKKSGKKEINLEHLGGHSGRAPLAFIFHYPLSIIN
jgi:hypothetical protein